MNKHEFENDNNIARELNENNDFSVIAVEIFRESCLPLVCFYSGNEPDKDSR